MAGLRDAAKPLTEYFDKRFGDLFRHVTNESNDVRTELQRLARHTDERLTPEVQTIAEVSLHLQELVARFADAAAANPLTMDRDALAGWLAENPEQLSRAVQELAGIRLADAPQGVLDFVNWANCHEGLAAQAGLWFNPPVTVELRDGRARAAALNERIVEVPYALAAAAALAPGSHVLDFGASESTLAVSLASLGLHTTAIDLRPYPLAHPLLRSVQTPIEAWEGPETPFDAIFCISTLEHVGLGWYGETGGGDDGRSDLDRQILERLGGWLAPEGELVFTAPFGAWAVDDIQRIYDAAHLESLFDGWKLLDRRYARRSAPTVWEAVAPAEAGPPWPFDAPGAVMLRARRRR